ncbi:MAG TPA: hypothetical protein PK280_02715 [Planctomycetota bacterium]|nr:hypothetical protein [Planctomycetota bacterium]
MPYRAPALLLMGLAGAVAVAGLVLIGIDVYAAKQRGPRWKRRLLGAGLAVLGILGIGYAARPGPTCYDMPSMPFTAPSLQRLESQASLLWQLISADRLDPEVARKALAATEAALVDASKEEVVTGLSPAERGRAENLRLTTWSTVEQTRIRLEGGDPGLAGSPDWLKLAAAWGEAEEVISGRRGQYPFDQAGKQRLLAQLDEAAAAADRLATTGLLSAAERDLLKKDLAEFKPGVEAKRPTEMRLATCYRPMSLATLHPAVHLAERLPLLEKMAAAGKVQPAVLRKVLVSVESDLAALQSDPKLLAHPDAEKTRDAAKAEVEKLRKSLEERKP